MSTPLLAERLIGRTALRASLSEELTAAASGDPRPVVLLGPAGIGKTRLLRDVADQVRARRGWALEGRAVEGAHGADAYRSLIEALADFDALSGCQPGDQLWIAWQSAVRALRAAAGRPLGLAEDLVRLFRVATRRVPLALALDDLQWTDTETLDVLTYLCDNTTAHGAVVVLSTRSDRVPPQLARLIERRVATGLEVPPLDRADVRDMVLECLGVDAVDTALVDFVQERADGVPFAVEELIAGLVRSGALVHDGIDWRVQTPLLHTVAPPTIAASVAGRVAALSPHGRSGLNAAAVLGHRFDWQLIAPVAGLDDDEAALALRESLDAGLLAQSPHGFSFRHALTRDETARMMLAPERQALAQRALGLLLGPSGEPVEQHADLALELAQHAGDESQWRRILLRSGLREAERGALGAAARRLRPLVEDERAGRDEIWEQAGVVLAETLGSIGDHVGARDVASRVLASRPRHVDHMRRVGEALVRASLVAGDYDVAGRDLTLLERDRDEPTTMQQVLTAQVLLGRGELNAAVATASSLVSRAAVSSSLRCEAFEILGRASRVRDVDEATHWFELELAEAERAGDRRWQARALHELGTIDLLDNLRIDRLTAARRLSLQSGDPTTTAHADFHLAEALVSRGETLAGRIAAERCADLAARLGSPVLGWAWLTMARSHAYDRDDPAMETAIDRALSQSGAEIEAIRAGISGRVLAMRALFGADSGTALEHLDAAATRLQRLPGHHFPHWGLWALVRAVHGALRPADRALAGGAAGAGTRFNQALLAAADAVQQGRAGDIGGASATSTRAEEQLRGYEHAGWMVHLTRWILLPCAVESGWGEPTTWAQEAVRWFGEHGHEPLAASCRRSLRQMGATVPRRGRGQSQVPPQLLERGISSREVDVLALVALRLPNAEIATRLVLSPRTVERHISSLLAKLELANRGELAQLAEQLSLV